MKLYIMVRHGSQIQLQLSAASPTNRPQPKVIITTVLIRLKLWQATGCKAKVAAELSSRPLISSEIYCDKIDRLEGNNYGIRFLLYT